MGRLSPADFHAVYGFRRPDVRPFEGAHARFAVWTIPSPSPGSFQSLGAARLVSTPSRPEYIAGLGSGLPFQVSPTLSSSASPVSRASTQVLLKSAAYAIPPRPRAAALLSDSYDRARCPILHIRFLRRSWRSSLGAPSSFLVFSFLWVRMTLRTGRQARS
jgi:hypothetical protein